MPILRRMSNISSSIMEGRLYRDRHIISEVGEISGSAALQASTCRAVVTEYLADIAALYFKATFFITGSSRCGPPSSANVVRKAEILGFYKRRCLSFIFVSACCILRILRKKLKFRNIKQICSFKRRRRRREGGSSTAKPRGAEACKWKSARKVSLPLWRARPPLPRA